MTGPEYDELLAEIEKVHASDDRHRALGHVQCWCGRWIAPDRLVENTCGARDCIRCEELDAKGGMIP